MINLARFFFVNILLNKFSFIFLSLLIVELI